MMILDPLKMIFFTWNFTPLQFTSSLWHLFDLFKWEWLRDVVIIKIIKKPWLHTMVLGSSAYSCPSHLDQSFALTFFKRHHWFKSFSYLWCKAMDCGNEVSSWARVSMVHLWIKPMGFIMLHLYYLGTTNFWLIIVLGLRLWENLILV